MAQGDSGAAGRMLVLPVATTGYMLIAIQLKERELVHLHGDDHTAYVPMIVPQLRGRG